MDYEALDTPARVSSVPTTSIPSEEYLKSCLESAPSRAREARRIYDELRAQRELVKRIENAVTSSTHIQPGVLETCLRIQPVKVDLSILFGKEWPVPARFDTFRDTNTGHQFMDLWPVPGSDAFAAKIIRLLDPAEKTVERIVGGMGLGKTYGAFVAFLAAWEISDRAGFSFLFDPVFALNNPDLLIEQLVILLHQLDAERLLQDLAPLHSLARGIPSPLYPSNLSGSIGSVVDGRSIIVSALSICRAHCHSMGRKFIIIVDQENALYKENSSPELSSFARDLAGKKVVDVTIFISSSSSDAVVGLDAPGVFTQIPLQLITTIVSTALVFSKKFKSFDENQKICLEEWIRYFNGEASFVEAVHERSRGCALETNSILEFLSNCPTAGNEQSPFKGFFESSMDELIEAHHITMEKLFSKKKGSRIRKLAYSLLMSSLDYHIGASPEALDRAGVWLWKRLHRITKKRGVACAEYLQTVIDGRYMSVEYMKTPRALTMRANIVLRSLPGSLYIDNEISEDLQINFSDGPFHHSSLIRGLKLEEKMTHIFISAQSLKIGHFIRTKSSAMNHFKSMLESEVICPFDRKVFCGPTVRDELNFLISNRDPHISQWIFLRPINEYFASIDFAILLLPKEDEPPVLLPIQVTETISNHVESDIMFRNGVKNSRNELKFNPLMEAFYEETNGSGRVQFIWVGSRLDDAKKAASSSSKFDKSSFFSVISEWRATSSIFFPEATTVVPLRSSFKNIGYSCGEAVDGARAKHQSRQEGQIPHYPPSRRRKIDNSK